MRSNRIAALVGGSMVAVGISASARASLFAQWLMNGPNPSDNTLVPENTGHPDAIFVNDATGAAPGTYVASPGGQALHFDGSVPNHMDLRFNGTFDSLPPAMYNDMSTAYWVKFDLNTVSYNTLLADADDSHANNLVNTVKWSNFTDGSGNYTKRYFSNNAAIGNGDANALVDVSTWYHLVWSVKYDSTEDFRTEKLYINGALKASVDYGGALVPFGNALRFGEVFRAGLLQEAFTGDLDQMEIYDNQLTDEQVAALYAAGPIGSANGWIYDGSGDWNTASHWFGGIPNAVDAAANFQPINTTAVTVFTEAPVTVGTLKFNSSHTYQIAGNGSLSIDVSTGSGSIAVLQGSHKINLPLFLNDNTTADVAGGATLLIADPMTLVAGSTLSKTGAGDLVIEAPVRNAGAAAMVVSGGTARLNYPVGTAASAGAAASAALDVSVTGSKLVLGANQVLRGLSAATANAGDQEIDLASYSAQIYSANASAAEQGIYNAIKNARLSASGKDGIYDSTIASSNYAVGVTDQAVDAHGDHLVVVRKTILGDTNVDGTVDVIDLGNLATSWQSSGLWDNGDSNFDGFIDVIDLGMLATNWQQSAGGPSLGEALAAYGLPAVSVPEPASIGLVGVAGGLMLSRKRRS